MESRATETKQAAKISTPNSLVNYSAAAAARHLINYCLPVLHDYFMAQQLDVFYMLKWQKMTRLGIRTYEHKFDVSKTTESLVAHIRFMKDYYWSGSVLCPPHYKSIRSLISKEIVKTLNSGELNDFEVSPLCKFVIQLLFCYDVGDFATGTVKVLQSACRPLGMLLQALGPFCVSFLDARSLQFAFLSPYEILLANAPDLKKIFIRDVFLGKSGMSLTSHMLSERLTEIGIEREGHYLLRYDLFKFFFKGQSQYDLTCLAYEHVPADVVTFPNLKRMYIYCFRGTECFHGIRSAIKKFYTNLVINTTDEPHFHTLCDVSCYEYIDSTFRLNMNHFSSLIRASPMLRESSVKFLNYDTYCDVNILKLSGSSSWFVRNRIENYMTSFGHFGGLKLRIYPDMGHDDEPFDLPVPDFAVNQYMHPNFELGLPRERQGFSCLLANIGKTLLMLTVCVTLAVDLREGLHCLNLCPVLREFTLVFNVIHSTDIEPLLRVDINTLPHLTKIVFRGGLNTNYLRVDELLRKIIKAAPNVRYVTLSGGLAKNIHLMTNDCFQGIDTLHLSDITINQCFFDNLTGVLQRCPNMRELLLENVNDADGWLKGVDKTTALSIRYIPKCSFLEDF